MDDDINQRRVTSLEQHQFQARRYDMWLELWKPLSGSRINYGNQARYLFLHKAVVATLCLPLSLTNADDHPETVKLESSKERSLGFLSNENLDYI